MKLVVESILGYGCALTGHFHGCWVLNGPLNRLWDWSTE